MAGTNYCHRAARPIKKMTPYEWHYSWEADFFLYWNSANSLVKSYLGKIKQSDEHIVPQIALTLIKSFYYSGHCEGNQPTTPALRPVACLLMWNNRRCFCQVARASPLDLSTCLRSTISRYDPPANYGPYPITVMGAPLKFRCLSLCLYLRIPSCFCLDHIIVIIFGKHVFRS